MIVASGIAEGFGLALLVPGLELGTGVITAAVLLALLNAFLWWRYIASARAQGIGVRARDTLERVTPWLHAFGHAVPVVLLAISTPVAGVAFIAGGALWKFALIVYAGYQQGFALERVPRRGSGTLAAPARLQGR